MKTRYPIYVISKGRVASCLTADFLIQDGCPFRLVVEPQEAGAYAEIYGRDRLEVLPFSNLGLGSIPARNWVWEHSRQGGHARHWILDDNIKHISRRYQGYRIRCNAIPALRASEDFFDRYENVAIGGLNYTMFSFKGIESSDGKGRPPYLLNCHVYSCLCIDNEIPFRWRGRYNEDTDLCLQVLSAGLCTVQLNVFLIAKVQTLKMKGGNSDQLYQGDGRLRMARINSIASP